jgi:hypothetical protein
MRWRIETMSMAARCIKSFFGISIGLVLGLIVGVIVGVLIGVGIAMATGVI